MKTVTTILCILSFCVLTSCKKTPLVDEPVRAYSIDYNWGEGGAHGFARPGLWVFEYIFLKKN
jgi:hypothetical protein